MNVVYKTKNSKTNYIIVLLLLSLAIYCLCINVNWMLIFLILLLILIFAFNDMLSIIVCDDRFIVKRSNIFGNFMSIADSYGYKKITHFDVKTTQKWKAKVSETALVLVVEAVLPVSSGRISESPKTSIIVEYIDDKFDKIKEEIYLGNINEDFIKAIEMIKFKLSLEQSSKK